MKMDGCADMHVFLCKIGIDGMNWPLVILGVWENMKIRRFLPLDRKQQSMNKDAPFHILQIHDMSICTHHSKPCHTRDKSM